MEEKLFADGFSFKRNENAPEFVAGRLSIKIDDAVNFMKKHQKNGWINLNVKKARTGNFYLELDTYTPKGGESSTEAKQMTNKAQSSKKPIEDTEEDLPF
jgi:hypothetical protein